MSHAWFIYSNEVVSGPFDTDTVREKLQDGHLSSGCFVWWKGQREWIQVAAWENQLDQLLEVAVERAQKPVWYMESAGNPVGPLTQNELIDNLRGIAHLNRIRLWAVGMKKWSSLFALPDIMELLGISRRENERAPLMGTVAVSRSNDDPRGFMVKTASISVAGMGLVGSHDLRVGDSVSLLIKSNEFPNNIHVRGQIAYVTAQGYAGIRFEVVNSETQGLILDYVKRFNSDAGAVVKKSA